MVNVATAPTSRTAGRWATVKREVVRDVPLSTGQVAAQLGIAAATWRVRVHREQAPPPDGMFDGRTPYWWQTTIDAYLTLTERMMEKSA